MSNQKEGVYQITMGVLAEAEIELEGRPILVIIEPTTKKRIVEAVAMNLENGTIELSTEARTKYNSIDKLKTYASGLVNNWFRKDTRLNGGTKYEAKNPGSRQNVGDPQLKALKALKVIKKDDEVAAAAIDEAIEIRTLELEETKSKKVVVNYDLIPEELRAKLGL